MNGSKPAKVTMKVQISMRLADSVSGRRLHSSMEDGSKQASQQPMVNDTEFGLAAGGI